MSDKLSMGAIKKIFDRHKPVSPRLQILDLKVMESGQSVKRHRLILSDGNHFLEAMLVAAMADLVTNGKLRKFCIVRLVDYHLISSQNNKMCVVTNCVICSHHDRVHGSPENIQTVLKAVSFNQPTAVKV